MKRFSTKDLIIIAILAAIGIAIKPLVSPISKAISAPLMLPGGSFAGGLYMMWLVLAIHITKKPGAGTLFGIIQALVVLIQSSFGNHGALSLLTYTIPGIVADILALGLRHRANLLSAIILCSMANMTGALIMAVIIFQHPPLMICVSLSTALASGIIGAYLAYLIHFELTKLHIIA